MEWNGDVTERNDVKKEEVKTQNDKKKKKKYNFFTVDRADREGRG